jgi:FMN phosphatase YigB (HAD superfamily)
MKESSNTIQEEFFLLAERLSLDSRFWSQGSGVKGLESELETFLSSYADQICVGPYMPDCNPLTTASLSSKGKGRLSDRTLESLVEVYKKLFLPNRQIKFIGVDLDDCLYDVTPIRGLISGVESLESRLKTPDSELRALYKTYEGVADTLRHLVDSGDSVVGILTNGPSRLQRDKVNLLGLKEGEHFNFVMVSEDVGTAKPSKEFFELAREKASQYLPPSREGAVKNEECLILEDKVENISGADGWLKVQFLKGHHSNTQPENIQEIPKYGIKRFSVLPTMLSLEKNRDFQALSASCFILKALLLLHQQAVNMT